MLELTPFFDTTIVSGKVKRHLHWECKKDSGECGENGEKSHGGYWDNVPENIKECARRHGFQGESATEQRTIPWDTIGTVGLGVAVGVGIWLAPEVTIPVIIINRAMQ